MPEGQSAFQRYLITIDWPFNQTPPVFRCPISGAVIHPGHDPKISNDPQDFVEPQYEEASTLLFAFPTVVGEFDFIRPELQRAIDEKKKELTESAPDNGGFFDFNILTEHIEDFGEAPLIYELRLSGMGDGPISDTVFLGLDLHRPFQHLAKPSFPEDGEPPQAPG